MPRYGGGKTASSRRGMVAAAFPDATDAGAGILARGGNAADAACAVSLALAVCEPQASGIGGQCMALVRMGGSSVVLDGSGRAPSLAHRSAFGNEADLSLGYRASTVPGMVATVGYLHERYGRLDWQEVVRPAVKLAKGGYRITELQSRLLSEYAGDLLSVPSRSGARYFLRDGCVPYGAGDLFVQEDLACLLEGLSESGYGSFYRGSVASRIDRDMRENGGYLRGEDLARVPIPVERRPVRGAYRGVGIETAPPPGSGDIMLDALSRFEDTPGGEMRERGPVTLLRMADAFRLCFADAEKSPPDPATYLQEAGRPSSRGSGDGAPGGGPPEDGDTTHLSVMDGEGNAVTMTQSVELMYGSKAAAAGLGFLYNNYMSVFDLRNASSPYYLRPNAVPRSSACPSILYRDGRPWIAVGSPGSSRIISAVSLFLSGVIDGGLSARGSMELPRIHCTSGGVVSMEDDTSMEGAARLLREDGRRVDVRERYSLYHGAIHAVLLEDGMFGGVAEARRDGTARGPD